MSIVQWVNLEKDEAYAADPDVGSVDRCGPLSVKAVFARNGVPLNFTVKAVPSGSDNVEYSSAEQLRNPNFRMPTEISGLAMEKQVTLDGAVKLPAAGGNKYKLEAKDANGVTVQSVDVEARRKLYYQVLAMDDAKGTVPIYSLAPMESHAARHFITLQKTGVTGKIPYRKTLTMHSGGNVAKFGTEVGQAYNISAAQKKVGVAVVFSDYIASMDSAKFEVILTAGSSNPRVVVSANDVTIVGDKYLWHGLDDAEDSSKLWFIDGGVEYSNPVTGEKDRYQFSRDNVDIAGGKHFSYGGYHQIKIRRDSRLNVLLGKTQGTLTFAIKVNVVGGWTNGFSWAPDGNHLITCARRVRWEDMPSNTQEYTWNHEIGHRFGMVAYGNREDLSKLHNYSKLPDGPPTLYSDATGVRYQGHRGPHCGMGAQYDYLKDSWSGTPGCVMFGANGIGNKHSPKEYCSECAPIVRKLDLS